LAFYGYSRAEFLALKASALSVGEPQSADGSTVVKHRRKDGREATLSLSVQEIEFDGRRADLVSAYDLSERLEQEEQLRRKAASGRAMLDAIADGVWVLDGEGRIIDVNAAYCRMTGFTREAL